MTNDQTTTIMKTILTFLFILAAGILSAQVQDQLLNTSSLSVEAEVDLAREQLSVTRRSEAASDARITNINLRLQEGNLVIGYELTEAGRNAYYRVALTLTLDGRPLSPRPESLSGDLGDNITTEGHATLKRIIWATPLETYPSLRGKLEARLTVQLFGTVGLPFNIDCAHPPSFTPPQQLPHYLAAGVGLGSVLIGQALVSNADDTYNNSYLTAETAVAAEPYFTDATNQRHTGLILTYAGAGVLAADAVWYVVRLVRYTKQRKAFERYCNPAGVSVRPVYRPALPGGGTPVVGLRIAVNMK